MQTRIVSFGLVAAALLSACGGGGSDADTTPPVVSGTPSDGVWAASPLLLSWANVTATDDRGVTGFRVQVATAPEESAAVATLSADAAATSVSFPATAWPDGTVFHFRVAALDAAGNQSAWTGFSDGVTLDAAPPSAPGTPAAAEFARATPVRFAWTAATDAVSGVVGYAVEIATATDGTGVVFSGDVGGALLVDQAATDGQVLHARVRARDGTGAFGPWSAWSAPSRVDLSAPALVSAAPADGASGVARSAAAVVLTFSEPLAPATVRDDTVRFLDALGTEVPHVRSLEGAVVTLTPSAPLANFGTFRVTVGSEVTDLAGWPVPADEVDVTFMTADDVEPVLAGGVTIPGPWAGASLPLSWSAATDDGSGLAGYELQVASLPSDGAVLATVPAAATSSVFDAAAYPDGAVFHARVRALDHAGNAGLWSAWSDAVTKDTTAPGAPGTPAAASPYALASPVRFDWTAAQDAVSGVAGYSVELATATDGSGVVFSGDVGAALFVERPALDGQVLFARVAARDALGLVGEASPWSAAVTVDLEPPGAPGTPADAGAFALSPAVFSWSAAADSASGVASYFLSVADETGAQVFEGDVGDVTSHAVVGADGALLFARVRALDAAGREGSFSPPSDGVRVDTSGPFAPGAPATAGPYTDAVADLSWGPATDAWSGVVRYLLELSQDDVFAVPQLVDAGAAPSSSVDVSTYADGQPLYLRVHAVDALGNAGALSDVGSVVLDRSPPDVPGTPVDRGAASFERAVHFGWAPSADAVSGLASYTVEIATSAGGPAVDRVTGVTGTSLAYAWTGPVPVTLFARIQAVDAVGNASEPSGDSDGIELRDDAPGTPGAPADAGAVTSSTSIAFSWTAPVAGGPLDGYELDVGTSPDGNDVVSRAVLPAEGSYLLDVSGRPNGETYYARVAARAGALTGAWSASSDGILVDRTPPEAPDAPTDRGDVDDRLVTFEWSPGADAESGIAAYEVEVFANGLSAGPPVRVEGATAHTFDAAGRNGETIAAQVRAVNGAGLAGPYGPLSDGLVVDTIAPTVVVTPGDGATDVPTGADVVLQFSEPMDEGLTEAGMALAVNGSPPRNGVAILWNGDSSRLTLVPDTADPFGATNADVLPERAQVRLTVAGTACDLAGNPLEAAVDATFATGDETAPVLTGLAVAGDPSPVSPAAVQDRFTFVLTFDEDMEPTRGGVALGGGARRLEGRVQTAAIQAATSAGGLLTFTTATCPDVRVGDVVTVRHVDPPAFDVTGAPVTAVDGAACTFSVAGSSPSPYVGGGLVAHPSGAGLRPAWTGPRTLAVAVESPFALPAGAEAEVEAWDVADASGNGTSVSTGLQVTALESNLPWLASWLPADGATGVPGMRPVVLRFSEPLDRTTLAGVTVVAGTDPDLYDVRYDGGEMGPVLLLLPRASPPPGTQVHVNVPGTVRDLGGNALPPLHFMFTVGEGRDVTAPVVAESLPPSGRQVGSLETVEVLFANEAGGLPDALDARSVGLEDVLVTDVATGLPVRGWRAEVEPGSAILTLRPPRAAALAAGGARRELDVLVGVPAFLGGTGISDAHGNAAAAASLRAVLDPSANRVPTLQSLRELRLETAVSPAGSGLALSFGLVDADGGSVDVSVTAEGGAVALPALTRTVTLSEGRGWYQHPAGGGFGGPPAATDPPELGAAPFGESRLYSFEITLDDGVETTTYVREAWLWSQGDLPVPISVSDGATRPVQADRPVVLETADHPLLEWGWSGTPGADADFLAGYVVPLSALDAGGQGVIVPADTTVMGTLVTLPTDAYLWAIAQQRFSPGSFDPRASGWSLDLASPLRSMMVRGPGNRALEDRYFGIARTSLAVDPVTGALSGLADATGWMHLERGPEDPFGVRSAPVFVDDYNLNDNAGGFLFPPPKELFAAGGDGTFMLSTTPAAGALPVPGHGFLGRSGTFFAAAVESETSPVLTAGAELLPIGSVAPGTLPGPMAYVQLEASAPGGVLSALGGSVGIASESAPGLLAVSGTGNDGAPVALEAPFGISSDLFGDFLQIDIGAAPSSFEFATGYLGGALGAEIVPLAADSTPDRIFWLLLARARPWAGDETAQTIHGVYRLADLTIQRDGSPDGLARASAASGVVAFDGFGAAGWQATSGGVTRSGTGTYAVDAAAQRVRLTVESPDGPSTFELVAGPDFTTLLGLGTSDPDRVEVLLLEAAP